MKKVFTVGMAFMFLVATAGSIRAAEGDLGKGIGYLIKKMSQEIVLEEFPEDSEDVVEVTYTLNDSTKFVNFDSLEDIQEFDDLEIEYKVVNGQRLAMSIFRSQAFENFSNEWGNMEEENIGAVTDSEDI